MLAGFARGGQRNHAVAPSRRGRLRGGTGRTVRWIEMLRVEESNRGAIAEAPMSGGRAHSTLPAPAVRRSATIRHLLLSAVLWFNYVLYWRVVLERGVDREAPVSLGLLGIPLYWKTKYSLRVRVILIALSVIYTVIAVLIILWGVLQITEAIRLLTS